MTDHDLVVADATLRGREGRWRIGIDGDRIAVVTRDAVGGREEVDAGGALVTESFVNGHLHLDKVHTLDRIGDAALTAYTAGDMASALTSIELASAVKAGYDRSWIEPNARRAVLEAVRHGVPHVLAFADVDTKARLEGVVPLLALREEFRGVVDLQVVAFPQEGLLCDPGAEEPSVRRSTSARTWWAASRGSSTPTPTPESTSGACARSPRPAGAASRCWSTTPATPRCARPRCSRPR